MQKFSKKTEHHIQIQSLEILQKREKFLATKKLFCVCSGDTLSIGPSLPVKFPSSPARRPVFGSATSVSCVETGRDEFTRCMREEGCASIDS